MALGDFAPQAVAYAARPSYPEALIERLIGRAGVQPGDRVADVGAGTGIFTMQLAARGLRVDAIDPSDAMRAQAPTHPSVAWRAGSFESTGLDDASVRWITAAQAFHWADPPRALPELRRVLTRGGPLTCLWNDRRDADSPVLAAVVDIYRREAPGFDELYRNRDWTSILCEGGWFEDAQLDEERHTITMSRDRFRGLWRSHNRLAESAGAGIGRVLAAIDALTADLEHVEVPYLTRAWTVRRAERQRGEGVWA